MEHSTSLRSLEAGGRPSGTGRPSLPSSRTERERESRSDTRQRDDARNERSDARDGRDAAQRAAQDESRSSARSEKARARAQRNDRDAAQTDADPTAPSSFESLLETHANEKDPAQPAGAEQPHDPARAGDTNTKGPHANAATDAQQTTEAAPEAESPAPSAGAETAPRTARAPLALAGLAVPGAAPLALASSAPSATPASGSEASLEELATATTTSKPADESAAGEPATPAHAPALPGADARSFANTLESAAPKAKPQETAAAASAPRPQTPAGTATGEPDRASEILRQMRVHFAPEMRSATIQLTPVELGRISIRLHLEQGELRAVVRAEKREALEALARHVPELRATLEQQGIQARQFDLQLGFQEPGARQHDPHSSADGNAARPREPQSAPRPEETRLARALAVHAGGVDTYA